MSIVTTEGDQHRQIIANRSDTTMRHRYSNSETKELLKALFTTENYQFSTFSSNKHKETMDKAIEDSNQQKSANSMAFNCDLTLNEFINSFYTVCGISSSAKDGMIQYEIHSNQSLNLLTSTTANHPAQTVWLPRSMIISDALRIISTILYSTDRSQIPVDLADYVFVYENIMLSLENYGKQLYEEILKITFRLNRVGLAPFRLLVIHKSQLVLLERKEMYQLLPEKKSISILQLIMFHLVERNTNQLTYENVNHRESFSSDNENRANKYWPIVEVKMGIIPSKQLAHPLKYDSLRQIINSIIRRNHLFDDIITNENHCKVLIENIFRSVNADLLHLNSILATLSKSIEVYDYPLLVALPYDRLMLSQFCNIQCSDGRLAQGILANGKYYSLIRNLYHPLSELNINQGSIIHLRFNRQNDTIVNGNISSQANKLTINETYDETSGYYCSINFDRNAVQLKFPSHAINPMIENTNTMLNNPRLDYLRSNLKASDNWTDSSLRIDNLIIDDTHELPSEHTNLMLTYPSNYLDNTSNNENNSLMLTNNASMLSLVPVGKPECSSCLSSLSDDNLECPLCTQVFCRVCIESNCDNETLDYTCPRCCNSARLSMFRKSTIIANFEREGTSVLKCQVCKATPIRHRLCRDPQCSALFCCDCYEKSVELQENNSIGAHKCPQCKTSDVYVSNEVLYYVNRIANYQTATDMESANPAFPNTVWKEEDYLPLIGTLEENFSRIISVIKFDGSHIQFNGREEDRPLLIINEPFEYVCPESIRLTYWNNQNQINRWENDESVQFRKYGRAAIAAYIPHFSIFTARNNRFREVIILDESFLNIVYDHDFDEDDRGQIFWRGTERYIRPCGWYRKAIRVLGKYENNNWLAENEKAWPVAYHGTESQNLLSILRNGLFAGGSYNIKRTNGQVHGDGIYLSPDPKYSSDNRYAKPFSFKNRQYKTMFQVRVRPDSFTRHGPFIWKCHNSQDVRPYGILIKEIHPSPSNAS